MGVALCAIASLGTEAQAQFWYGYGGNAQHTALGAKASQIPSFIRWSIPVDLQPQNPGGSDLSIHYGSPAITSNNTVIFPVKIQAYGDYVIRAVAGATGREVWRLATDYTFPPGWGWVPTVGVTLVPGDTKVAIPGAGGTILIRTNPNAAAGTVTRYAFYGIANYNSSPEDFNSNIQICTPITSDSSGNLYFGYYSTGQAVPGYENGIPSGLARLSPNGTGAFVSASALTSGNATKIAYNCTPAVTSDGQSVYVGANSGYWGPGYLCLAQAATLTPTNSVSLLDPRQGYGTAVVIDDSTASPTIGPDGDVYYGVLEGGPYPSNHGRGWLLHFNGGLTATKLPNAFGWDDSASVVPSNLLGSNYTGSSPYLLLTKYNNYADPGFNGDGQNKVAIVDPNQSMVDPISQATVMKTVITLLGPTMNPELPGVNEWCINSAAIDQVNKCAVVNSEDGHVYRWNLTTNTHTPGLKLATPTGEPYTPTLYGPDGAVYAINDGVLYCCDAGNAGVPATAPFMVSLEGLRRFLVSDLHGAIGIGLGVALAVAYAIRRRRNRFAAPAVPSVITALSA
jgi:hypothetical protein